MIQIGRQTERHIDSQTDRQSGIQTDRQTDRQTEPEMQRRGSESFERLDGPAIDRQSERQTDRQTDRQTETVRQTVKDRDAKMRKMKRSNGQMTWPLAIQLSTSSLNEFWFYRVIYAKSLLTNGITWFLDHFEYF